MKPHYRLHYFEGGWWAVVPVRPPPRSALYARPFPFRSSAEAIKGVLR